MKNKKIFNDLVYGFVGIFYGIIFNLVEYFYFQCLWCIKQMSLMYLVYFGALYICFYYVLGVLYLMQQVIEVLCFKDVYIMQEEVEGVCIVILFYDIGYGFFFYILEYMFMQVMYEDFFLYFMEEFNEVFQGRLELAMFIFKDEYYKFFLYQLVFG